jgi:acyl-homoserine-lactone acylase
MGVILGGIPIVVIGFNKDVAWTHTVTTAVHFTTFRLALDPRDGTGTSYLSDGVSVKMRAKPVTIESRMPNGRITSRSKTFYFSKQGAVLVKPEAGLSWTAGTVHVLADPNRNNTRLIDQWIGIGSAASVHNDFAGQDRRPAVDQHRRRPRRRCLFADASVMPRVGATSSPRCWWCRRC